MYRYLLFPLSLLQIATTLFLGTPLSQSQDAYAAHNHVTAFPPETPIALMGLVWTLFLVAALALSIQLLRRETELTRRVSRPLVLCLFFNIILIAVSSLTGSKVGTLLVTLLVAACVWQSFNQFNSMRDLGGNLEKATTTLSLGLLAGWTVFLLATLLPGALREMTGLGDTDAVWQMLLLVLLVLGAGAIAFQHFVGRNLIFRLVLGFGLLSIVLNHVFNTGMQPMAVVSILFGLGMFTWLSAKHRRVPN